MTSTEIVTLTNNEDNQDARAAATSFGSDQLHLAAMAAGLGEWMSGLDSYDSRKINSRVVTALALPFPNSEITGDIRQAGPPDGQPVLDTSSNGWTLDMAPPAVAYSSSFNSGVRLVIERRLGKSRDGGKVVRVPLAIEVPNYSVAEVQSGRPDKVHVLLGKERLTSSVILTELDAQRLLIVTANFKRLLASGQAAELEPVKTPKSAALCL